MYVCGGTGEEHNLFLLCGLYYKEPKERERDRVWVVIRVGRGIAIGTRGVTR